MTVDVDGVAGLPDGGNGWEERLSSQSERLYGLGRGLERVLSALAEFGVAATFYVPGVVASEHPDEVRGIVEAGHELGHHGHTHRRPDTLSGEEQRAELRDGLEALGKIARVHGYRAPAWELTPVTLALLGEYEFTHDSSLMADDRPYRIRAGDRELVELPVHWTLDDAPHFAHTTDPAALLDVWQAELESAIAEDRHITYTLHPDILGRPHRIVVLRRLLDSLRRRGIGTATHSQAARCA